jgi:RNA-directed DNA polymerase
MIADLNPLLRGWGSCFRTGNAAVKFRQAGDYVVLRLRRLMIKRRGRNLRPGQASAWREDWFNGHGLCRLRGKPLVRIERGTGKRAVTAPRP